MGEQWAGYSYEHEDEVRWLQPPDSLRYVREALVVCRFRARQPHAAPDARLVAYSTLRADAPPERTHRFLRRVWYAVPEAEMGTPPADAVAVSSIRAGQISQQANVLLSPALEMYDWGAGLETQEPPMPTEAEPAGLAFRVKRVSVPCDPVGAAAVLQRHFTPSQLRELAAVIERQAGVSGELQTA